MERGVIFITGGGVGIGRATAYEFARHKYSVAITYHRSESEAQETVNQCRKLGAPDAIAIPLDLMDDRSIVSAVQAVIRRYQKISVLINNAGVAIRKSLRDQSSEEIQQQIRVNLEGLIKITKESLPHIEGGIINIASGAGKTGIPFLATYCATKFGVRGFTQAIAGEYSRLLILSVNPDTTATRMSNYRGRPPEEVARVIFDATRGCYALPSGSDIDLWTPPAIDTSICSD